MVIGFGTCWQAAARSPHVENVGFSIVQADVSSEKPAKIGIWYPTKAPAAKHGIGLFIQTVAPDASVDGRRHPLIVISHGNAGTLEGHYDTALALAHAGFIVAAVRHPGDNAQDQSRATHLEDRPRTIHQVIDYMLTAWSGHAAIDPARIGMFGFSAGGLTTLISVGGVPDLTRVAPYCADHAATFICTLLKTHPRESGATIPLTAWVADRRIKAAVVAAPALGFVFSRNGLAKVRVPIQLWRAQDDQVLPSPDYAEPVRDRLPVKPEYHVVSSADHLDFLAPCSEALAHVEPVICQEHDGFNRAAFHRDFNRSVILFFQRTLGR